MIELIWAQLYMISKQKQTYYGLAALFIIELFIIAGSWYQGSEILEMVLENLSKKFYLEGNLLNGNLILYIVLNSLWFNLPLIIMIVVSGFVTNEYKDRTMQLILLQTVSKAQYVFSKYIISIIFTCFVLLFLLASASLMAYGIFGGGDLIVYIDGLNFFEPDEARSRLLMAFACGGLLMVFYSILSITISIFCKEPTISWIVCALFLVINTLVLKVDFGVMNNWLLPKMIDTWQYFFQYEIPWKSIYQNILILCGYIAVTIGLGTFVFVKRDIG